MKDSKAATKQLLQQIEARQVSAEEGYRLYRELLSNGASARQEVAEAPRPIQALGTGVRDIAIIGMSCRFPGGKDAEAFWRSLAEGRCAVREVPPDRWDPAEHYDPNPKAVEKSYCKHGAFLEDIDAFDPLFFHISPREAALMDPQQRLFLQEAWRAFEDAGYSDKELSGLRCGVFVGCGESDYALEISRAGVKTDAYTIGGTLTYALPSRISYFLNLLGPSMAINTSCSSSLVAMHLACESIRSGTSELALVGGVAMFITEAGYILLSKTGALSAQGLCRAFDDGADGFVPGEGVGAIVLKPLDAALRDRNPIYGVIKGSEINQDGKTNGMSAPSSASQTALECAVYNKFSVHPETLQYVEAHGTGTKLGDPIEFDALTDAFRKFTDKRQFCALGSVKTNIGHTQFTAGVASIIKILLGLKHRQIPPSLHFQRQNRHIKLQESPFFINTELRAWEAPPGQPRRAATSSFGMSGTNCHAIIEEPPSAQREGRARPFSLIPLSAKADAVLGARVSELLAWLEGEGAQASLEEIAYTLQVGRSHFNARAAFLVSSREELRAQLQQALGAQVKAASPDGPRLDRKELRKQVQALVQELAVLDLANRDAWRQKLDQLRSLYLAGADVDWAKIYAPAEYARIRMPTYPFAQERHWVPRDEHVKTVSAPSGRRAAVEEPLYYQPIWTEEPIAAPSTQARLELGQGESVLVFDCDDALAQRLRQGFIQEPERVILVLPGEYFERLDPQTFRINPTAPEDYARLFSELQGSQRLPGHLLQLWPFHSGRDPRLRLPETSLSAGLYHVFCTIQGIAKISLNTLRRFVYVHGEAEGAAQPLFSAAAGYGRSLGLLFPRVSFSTVGLVGEGATSAQVAIDELLAGARTQEVQYRQGRRSVRRMEGLTLPRGAGVRLRHKGVYLIAGGLGGLGLLFARHLAENHQARLVLVSRSEPTAEGRKAIEELKGLGAEVLHVRADIGSREAMAHAIHEARAAFGAIHGVINSAGHEGPTPIHQKALAEFEGTLRPKVQGSLVLDEVTKDEPLDWFVMFSSSASVLGDFARCDYAVANRFLDDFVPVRESLRAQGRRSGRTFAISWSLWRDGGMRGSAEGEELYLKSSGLSYLEREPGLLAFERILDSGHAQVLVMAGERGRIDRLLGLKSASVEGSRVASAPVAPKPPPPPVSSEAGTPLLERLAKEVRARAAQVAQMDPERLDPQENLGNFGFDSMALKELAGDLGSLFGVDISPVAFFEYSDVSAISRYLLENFRDKIEAFFPEEPAPAPTPVALPVREAPVSRGGTDAAIAVIGMSGVFPRSADLEEFWRHLEARRDLISETPPERWDWRAYQDQFKAGQEYLRWGGFIDDVDKFDAAFFSIVPREAELMDPQHRVFLQEAWKAVEDAGYRMSELSGRQIGVFAGVQINEYLQLLAGQADKIAQAGTGNVSAMLANRVSFLFNLRGPSESIDTACSSSLVAVHHAVRAIREGECEMALAGGVSLMLSPSTVLGASRIGILSPDGRCKTFDRRANGYVKGEGVGVVLLKPLAAALADGDEIHAVIRGTGQSHGGKANSLTAPNAEAQAQLLTRVYREAGVEPGSVSYVETHGTGTELGDPVEIEALKKVFPTAARGAFCALGALKTNIGHLEPASGIAGMLKAILAMRHGRLPGNVHLEQPNPLIRLEGSPFFLLTETRPWDRLMAESGEEIPRRAGISSFGFGGAYAHVILEEPPQAREPRPLVPRPQVLVLSAKKQERLREYARVMARYAQRHPSLAREEAARLLEDLAYTLQLGREALPERLAVVASDLEEAARQWSAFAEGQPGAYLQGSTKGAQAEARRAELVAAPGSGRLDEFAAKWVVGGEVDFRALHEGSRPRRIHVPTHPFSKDRHWVEGKPEERRPRFTRTIRRDERIVAEHKVQGRPTLPGVGYLGLVYEAVRRAKPAGHYRLTKIAWLHPLVVEGASVEVEVELEESGQTLQFTVMSQGARHAVGSFEAMGALGEAEPRHSIEAIQARCPHGLEGASLYSALKQFGLEFGPYFQGLRRLRGGDGESLAWLRLPEGVEHELMELPLHPSLMDAALQSTAGIRSEGSGGTRQTFLPFSIDGIDVHRPLSRELLAYARRLGEQRYEVSLMDQEGRVCVHIREVAFRPLRDPLESFFFLPRWREASADESPQPVPAVGTRTVWVVHGPGEEDLLSELVEAHSTDRVLRIALDGAEVDGALSIDSSAPEAWKELLAQRSSPEFIYFVSGLTPGGPSLEGLAPSQQRGVLSLFRLVQALTAHGQEGRALELKVITADCLQVGGDEALCPFAASLHGLTLSMAKEYPTWAVSCVDVSGLELQGSAHLRRELWESVRQERARKPAQAIALRGGRRYLRELRPARIPPAEQVPFRKGGVYLILGGAGGIGLELSRYLSKSVQAKVVLLGRRPLDAGLQSQLDQIASLGGEALYVQADATDLESMRQAVRSAKARFGAIHGAIHSALVLRDGGLRTLSEVTFLAALGPKVTGSVTLAEALRHEPLDFLLFFSSNQSFTCNAGQSNYAAGCTFKDAYASALARQRPYPVKIINWGYWGTVGAVAGEEYKKRIEAQGVFSILPEEGMEAVARVLASRAEQVVPMKVADKVLEAMGIRKDHLLERQPQQYPPSLQRIELRLKAITDAVPQPDPERSREAFGALERFARHLLLKALRQMGVFLGAGERHVPATLAQQLGVSARYSRLYAAMLDMLQRAGFLRREGEWLVVEPIVSEPATRALLDGLAEEKERVAAHHPEVRAHVHLLWACVPRSPEILTGRIPATDVMFPQGSNELVGAIYSGNVVADSLNQQVVACVEAFVRERLQGPLRILEVGAGTGGTSAPVLRALQSLGASLEYHYTDVSRTFTQFGQRQFGAEYPFLQFEVLDIERPPREQGFEPGSFDLVIATNVLHATREFARTLRHIKSLLKGNGWIVINEATEVLDFATLSFGLLEGWWRYEDEEQRLPHSPLMDSGMWRRMLAREGFAPCLILPPFHQVMVAENDGWISEESADTRPSAEAPVPTLAPVPVRPASPQASAQPNRQALRRHVENTIAECLSLVLKIEAEAFDPDLPYSDFGVDSIFAIEIATQIGNRLAITLRTTDLFNYGTIRQLATHIVEEHGDIVARGLAGEAPAPEPIHAEAPAMSSAAPSPATESAEEGGVLAWYSGDGPEAEFAPAPAAQPAPAQVTAQSAGVGSFDIAVVGMAGQFPEAENLQQFWRNLTQGRDSVTPVPAWRRWKNLSADPLLDIYRWGGFLDHPEYFDSLFFNISPKEAELMDPQQRVFLQTAWHAFEDAGYARRDLEGAKCGVFVGCSEGDYISLVKAGVEETESVALTGSASSILPARVSYFLNLKGPSLAVNTACSSSLVALELACESLWTGASDLAMAGGVSVLATPELHRSSGAAGMLSPDGRCKTFDDSGNGFVPAEGVGAVVLKPLARALEEGDHIYAVIKGIGTNQDGKTNGITAPSATSQTALEREVYEKFNLPPESISYVEAHGTGTRLGDPIEISALKDSFASFTRKKDFCAIGSVKSNIGHTLGAAGIAGFLKVLLCMQHKKLVPSLHFQTENRHIQFQDSPFYVNTELKDWEPTAGYPRRATVSSFGFSGTNAHVVVEEFQGPPGRAWQEPASPQIVVLSARTKERLRAYAKVLVEHLDEMGGVDGDGVGQPPRLADIAFTLQVGREPMEERLALVARDLEELRRHLMSFVEERPEGSGFFLGRVRAGKAIAETLVEGDEGAEFVQKLARNRRMDKLARLWTMGIDIDWRLLHHGSSPRRVPLPPYPFERQAHWVHARPSPTRRVGGVLHPLLDAVDTRRSLSEGITFRKTLTASEPVVALHRVAESPTLPGVAYLEMALRAMGSVDAEQGYALSRVVWLQPVVVGEGEVTVYLRLSPGSDAIGFEFSSDSGGEQPIVHAVGELDAFEPEEDVYLDIEELQASCPRQVSGEQLYEGIRRSGVIHEGLFRSLKDVWCNEEEALATLQVPEEFAHEFEAYRLYPGLLDGALQAVAGLQASTREAILQPVLPFSVERLELLHPLPAQCYAYVRAAGEHRYNIALLDSSGRICLKMHEVSFRPMRDPLDGLFYQPDWVPLAELPSDAESEAGRSVLLFYPAGAEALAQALIDHHSGDSVTALPLPEAEQEGELKRFFEEQVQQQEAIDCIYFLGGVAADSGTPMGINSLEGAEQKGVRSLFHLVKALIHTGHDQNPLCLKVLTSDALPVFQGEPLQPFAASLHGLTRSMAKEFPDWEIACVDLSMADVTDPHEPEEYQHLAALIAREPGDKVGHEVALRGEERYGRVLRPIQLPPPEDLNLRPEGVYLIFGGAGGLGLAVAEFLAETVQARLVLLGRRPRDTAIEQALAGIEAKGGQGIYLRADMTDLESTREAVATAKAHFGAIHGAIHSALVLEDKTLRNMDEGAFLRALEPKTRGSVVMAEALAEEPLDFLLFFSSLQSFTCAPGQSNYAAGCTFKDAFAHHLASRVEYPVQVINWGYWGSVGRVANDEYRARLASQGVLSIEPREGIEAVRRVLGSRLPQVMLLKSQPAFLEWLGVQWEPQEGADAGESEQPGSLEDQLQAVERESAGALAELLDSLDQGNQALAGLGAYRLLAAFQRMGVFEQAGEVHEVDSLREALGVVPRYQRLFDALLDMLHRAEWIEFGDGQVRVRELPDAEGLSPEAGLAAKKALQQEHPDFSPHAELLWMCVEALPEVLTGGTPATEILFPESSKGQVEAIYRGNILADALNDLVAHSIRVYLERRATEVGAPLRVLEVGAGTGGTTERVLPVIAATGLEVVYTYTDISVGFLTYGEGKFKDPFPFTEFERLDIEQDVEEQGFTPGGYDVVIATNVLHATKRIANTLSQVRTLLGEGGVLVVNELTSLNDFTTLTFGLLDGWWAFEDAEERLPHSPVLSAEMWAEQMRQVGFVDPVALGPGGRVVIAGRPGEP